MFFEIVKDFRTGVLKSHGFVNVNDVVKKHPYCLDLHGWLKGGRLNSRFGLSNPSESFLYIKTDEKDKSKLEQLARSV